MLKNDPSVYLLAGTEQFLKEEKLAKIKSSYLLPQSADFNFNVFYAASASAQQILECALTAPFLSRKRIVLVRQLQALSGASEKPILSYVKNPSRQTILILETSEADLQQNFFAEIAKSAEVIFYKPLQGAQLFAWLNTRVEKRGKKIEPKAAKLLVENLGNNLWFLDSSLDNLALYIAEKKTIEHHHVEQLVGRDVTRSAFELFNAVIIRDQDKSLQVLDSLLKDGINSAQILGALAHKIISERTQLNSRLRQQYLLDLQTTDADIKTGRQSQRIALELLVARLVNT